MSNVILSPTGLSFSPTQVAGLSVWVDANDQTRFTLSGSNVATLTDKASGTSYTIGGTPTWASNAFPTAQGRLLPGFNTTNGRFISATISPAFPTFNGTYFLVTQLLTTPAGAGYPAIAVAQSNTGSAQFFRPLDYTAANYRTVAFGPAATPVALMNVPVLNTPILLSVSFSNATNPFNNWLYTRGTNSNFNPASNSPAFTVNGSFLMIGTDGFTGNTGVNFWPGVFGEVIAFSTVLSAANRQNVEAYLAAKWGFTTMLQSSHSYQSSPIPAFPAPWVPYIGIPSTVMFYNSNNPPVLTGPTYFAPPVLGSGIFNPRTITGTQLWLDAADSSTTVLTGTTLSQWSDKSGCNFHVTPSVVGSNATLSSNFLNGLNAINFAGSNQYISPRNSASYPVTCFLALSVSQGVGTPAGCNDFLSICANTTDNMTCLNTGAYTPYVYSQSSSLGARSFNTGVTQTSNQTVVLSWRLANNNMVIFQNGSNIGSNAGFTWSKPTDAQYFIGWRVPSTIVIGGGVYPLYAYYGEVLVYNSVLSDFDQRRVEGYLAWKWGSQSRLIANHPYSLFPPPP